MSDSILWPPLYLQTCSLSLIQRYCIKLFVEYITYHMKAINYNWHVYKNVTVLTYLFTLRPIDIRFPSYMLMWQNTRDRSLFLLPRVHVNRDRIKSYFLKWYSSSIRIRTHNKVYYPHMLSQMEAGLMWNGESNPRWRCLRLSLAETIIIASSDPLNIIT